MAHPVATGAVNYRTSARRSISSATSSAEALSTTYALLTVTGLPTTRRAYLSSVFLALTSVVTATSVTWYMSSDAAGDAPITAVQTDTIVYQTGGEGGVARVLDFALHTLTGNVYVWVKTNAGTATGTVSVAWEE